MPMYSQNEIDEAVAAGAITPDAATQLILQAVNATMPAASRT